MVNLAVHPESGTTLLDSNFINAQANINAISDQVMGFFYSVYDF
jgi:hypothetical protein